MSSLFTILLLQPVFFLLQPGLLCLRSFFFNQSSFFGLVRPGGESVRDGDGGDGEGPVAGAHPRTAGACRRAHRWWRSWSPWRWRAPPVATPRHARPRATCCCCCRCPSLLLCRKDNCCCCNFKKCFAAAGPALGGSSQAPPSSCDLLRPGLL